MDEAGEGWQHSGKLALLTILVVVVSAWFGHPENVGFFVGTNSHRITELRQTG